MLQANLLQQTLDLLPKLLLILVVAILVTSGSASPARESLDEAWLVVESTGQVRYRAPEWDEWRPVQANEILAAGSRIVSSDASSAILSRGTDSIRLGPRSRMMLPDAAAGPVRQEAGNARFRIEPRRPGEQRFSVETPYAALVVKGTVFDVTVDPAGFEVAVDEGVVEVSSRDRGQTAEVRPGQRARHAAAADAALEMQSRPGAAFEPAPAPPSEARATTARPAAAPSGPEQARGQRNRAAQAPLEAPRGVFARMGAAFRDVFSGGTPAGRDRGPGLSGGPAGIGRGERGGPGDNDGFGQPRGDAGHGYGKNGKGNNGVRDGGQGEGRGKGKGKGQANGKGKGKGKGKGEG